MAEKLTLQQIRDLQDAAMKEMSEGKGLDEVIHSLTAGGMDERTAQRIATNAQAQLQRSTPQREGVPSPAEVSRRGIGRLDMIAGAVLVVFGIAATVVSHMTAGPNSFVIFPYGFILFGSYLFLRGMRKVSR